MSSSPHYITSTPPPSILTAIRSSFKSPTHVYPLGPFDADTHSRPRTIAESTFVASDTLPRHTMADDDGFDSLDDEPVEKSLGDLIFDRLQEHSSTYDGKHFLPEGCIDELVTRDTVIKELDLPPGKKKYENQVIRFIFGEDEGLKDGAKKLFAITLLSGIQRDHHGVTKAMLKFHKSGIHDNCLPLKTQQCEAFIGSEPGSYSAPWSGPAVGNFNTHQGAFLAPVFTQEVPRLTLDPGCVLPIVANSGERQTGAFGEVAQVTIHEKHWAAPILKVKPATHPSHTTTSY